MRKVNIGMAAFCLLLGVLFLALFFYGIVVSRQIDPVMLMCLVGIILTARVIWQRAKQSPEGGIEIKKKPNQ